MTQNRLLTKRTVWQGLRIELVNNHQLYLMLLPVVAYYIVFHYIPMSGAQIAFRRFSFSKGIWGSAWVGLENFNDFFSSIYAERLIRNTLLLSLYNMVFGFPLPILLALMINEVRHKKYKLAVQTASYLPHFISLVVVCALVKNFFGADGILTQLLRAFGLEPRNYMLDQNAYRPIYTFSTIWQQSGWDSIIFLAALSGINMELYEAARLDGANCVQQTFHITLPGIAPTIVIMLILRVGWMMDLGSEKTLLLYNPSTYETADTIASYVYRKGLAEMNYSYSSAVDLFNSVISFIMLVSVNAVSKRLTGNSLF